MPSPHIVLLCATLRGLACLDKIRSLLPHARIDVASFREENGEPPFFENIREFCRRHNYEFHNAKKLENNPLVHNWQISPPDCLIAINWRYLIPKEIYLLPRNGSYVFHDSLLPKYRGFSPTVWAIINGEEQTGASLLEMNEGTDSGNIVDQIPVPLADKSIAQVFSAVTAAYISLIERHITSLANGKIKSTPQNHSLATFCCKRLPEDNRIDWQKPAKQIHDLIRAVSAPYSGAFTYLNDKKLIIWSSQYKADTSFVGNVPGRIVKVDEKEGVTVLTGEGTVTICEVETEELGRQTASRVLNRLSLTLR